MLKLQVLPHLHIVEALCDSVSGATNLLPIPPYHHILVHESENFESSTRMTGVGGIFSWQIPVVAFERDQYCNSKRNLSKRCLLGKTLLLPAFVWKHLLLLLGLFV